MEEERNILPPLATSEDTLLAELQQYLMSAAVDYPEPHYLLEYAGVGFSPLGGIQAISGQKKNGKTFVLTQLMAAILNSDSERVRAKLPGLQISRSTLEHIGHPPTILYVDTEMEKLNTAKVIRRVHWLCGWEMKADNERFHTLWLRTVETPAEKIDIIRKAIALFQPTAIFIDGLRDLVSDFNSLEETAPLVLNLMKTATENDCAIWNVLHMNPRLKNDDDDGKMRGHLGTELGNKVTDTFASFKKKAADGTVTFTVKQLDARGKDVPDWTFQIVDAAGGLGIPRIIEGTVPATAAKAEKDVDEQELAQIIDALRKVIVPPQRYREILNGLKALGIGTSKAQRWFSVACDANVIDAPINGLYSFNEINAKMIEDEIPF